jgi:hypothetical protein
MQTPVHLDEVKLNMVEYMESGLPSCVGSSDCTHILMQGCEYNLKNNHIGGKSSNTTCTFNLTCNHQWSYEVMVHLDNFILGIHDG